MARESRLLMKAMVLDHGVDHDHHADADLVVVAEVVRVQDLVQEADQEGDQDLDRRADPGHVIDILDRVLDLDPDR